LTGAATIVLALLATGIIAAAVGRSHGEAARIVGSPFAAAVFVLLFAATAVHMRIGMQAIVEDYISSAGLKVVLLAANTFFSYAVAVVAIVAVLKLAVGGL
jgi:succinate dehydrogenase / fumarate reductase membrane anchor subunit